MPGVGILLNMFLEFTKRLMHYNEYIKESLKEAPAISKVVCKIIDNVRIKDNFTIRTY